MKNLITIILIVLIISISFVGVQSTNAESTIEERETWIQSVLSEQGKYINSNDYIFYCTGHHGIIWSLITSDSSKIHLYNGTTREHIDYKNQRIPDTLTFIMNNIITITWGLDSLAKAEQLFAPLRNEVYNPIYNELDIIQDGKMVFNYNDREHYYTGSDSINFNNNLNKLKFLMFWLAAPSCRPYMPIPGDTLLIK